MKRLFTLVLGAATLVAVQGCSKKAALYFGGPAGPMASIALSSSLFDIRVDQSVTVGARGEDAVGNLTADAVSFASCDGSVVAVASGTAPENYSTGATLTGAGLGESCVNVTAGGVTREITVNVGPTALKIVGDPIVSYNADDPSANGPFEFTVAPVDADGNALTGTVPLDWETSDESLFLVDHTDGTILQTLALGAGTLSVTAPGGANDGVTIKVAAPAFTGTASANTGIQGDLLTLDRAASGPVFDANSVPYFNFGGVETFIESMTADQMVVVVPTMGVAGRADLVVSGYGPADLDRRVLFNSPAATWEDRYSPGNYTVAGAPEISSIITANGNFYLSHSGHGAGSWGPWAAGGPDPDHLFKVTVGGTPLTVSVQVSWFDGSDFDIGLCLSDLATCAGSGGSGSTTGESMTNVALAANTTYYLVISAWDSGSNNTNMKVHVTGLP